MQGPPGAVAGFANNGPRALGRTLAAYPQTQQLLVVQRPQAIGAVTLGLSAPVAFAVGGLTLAVHFLYPWDFWDSRVGHNSDTDIERQGGGLCTPIFSV